ncbi:MAG TPA: hypothetical protein VIJ75_22465 [Hanamia sp.]
MQLNLILGFPFYRLRIAALIIRWVRIRAKPKLVLSEVDVSNSIFSFVYSHSPLLFEKSISHFKHTLQSFAIAAANISEYSIKQLIYIYLTKKLEL